MTSETGCSDTAYDYQISYNHDTCGYDVDLNSRVAYELGKAEYVNQSGTVITLTSCQRHGRAYKAITLTEDGCNHVINDTTAQIEQKYVYTDAYGSVINVSSCAATGQTIALQWTTGGCDLRVNFSANAVYRQSRRYYLYNGAEYRAGGCEDHDAPLPIVTSGDGCPTYYDEGRRESIPYKKKVVNIANALTTVADCAATTTVAATKDTNGCIGQYVHYPVASVSYGMSRYAYTAAGVTQYTACALDTSIAYPLQERGGAWEHNDGYRASRQEIIRYVSTPTGNIDLATRLSDWVGDYVETSREDRPNITATTYNGCQRSVPNNTYITYTRSDQTSVTLAAGAAAPTISPDGCWSIEPEYTLVSGTSGGNWMWQCYVAPRRQNGAGTIFSDPPYDAGAVDRSSCNAEHFGG